METGPVACQVSLARRDLVIYLEWAYFDGGTDNSSQGIREGFGRSVCPLPDRLYSVYTNS
jgi:hypothetical protein